MRTSLYSILCIVVRLGAVLLLVQTIALLATLLPSAQGDVFGADGWVVLLGLGVFLMVLALLLWRYPGALVRLATSRSSRESFESPIDATQLQYIAFSVLGLVFAVGSLADLVVVILRVALAANVGGIAFMGMLWQEGARVAGLLLSFAIGIGLTLGAHGLTGVLYRLRERGLPPAQADSDPEQVPSSKP